MKKRILAIHAHPDDIEILAGGTMAILAARGHQITMATMTPGDCGTRDYSAEEIAAIRRAEAARSASLIGADYVCVEFRDMAVFNDDSSRRRVTEVIRQWRTNGVSGGSDGNARAVSRSCQLSAGSPVMRATSARRTRATRRSRSG